MNQSSSTNITGRSGTVDASPNGIRGTNSTVNAGSMFSHHSSSHLYLHQQNGQQQYQRPPMFVSRPMQHLLEQSNSLVSPTSSNNQVYSITSSNVRQQPIYDPIYQTLQRATNSGNSKTYHAASAYSQQLSACQPQPVGNEMTFSVEAGATKMPGNQQHLHAGHLRQQLQATSGASNVEPQLHSTHGNYQNHQYQYQVAKSSQHQQSPMPLQSISKFSHFQPAPSSTASGNSVQSYRISSTTTMTDSVKNLSQSGKSIPSILPVSFTTPNIYRSQNCHDVSPNVSAGGSCSGNSVATNSASSDFCSRWPRGTDNVNLNAMSLTTNQRSKLVDTSSSTISLSQLGANKTEQMTQQQHQQHSKFKAYLTHLVLSSNIPFAYAIILVAFLITIIAATSIITVLTIILTITGYTAYPITENTFNTSLAIGVVCASFALALVTAILVVWRRHCQAAYYYLDDPQSASRGTESPQLSETYDDTEYGSVPVVEWAKHVQRLHADSDIGFSREFEQIQQATNNANFTYEHSQLPENKHKNRYINIVAYDHTRVTLRTPPGQKKLGSDYINANFIDGYNKPRAYIGTQGPLVSTFDDYWRMIWEQRVVIIVMITNLQERGRRKCDMYWPKEGTETYGHIQVKLLQEVVMATYTLRTFTAKNLKMKKRAGSERTVYQYHYTNWPDHGVPDHPLPVLSFVRKSASANPPHGGGIICHCSAGCGRSGTYIVIDAMLKQIRHRQSINVVDFLKHIRSQRNYLVQTEEQYVFIHDALAEAIESGETEIASNFISKYLQLLQTGGTAQAVAAANGLPGQNKLSNYSLSNGIQSPHQANQQAALSVSNTEHQLADSHSNLLLANGGANALTLTSNSKSSIAANTTNTSRSQSASGGQWSLLERQYRLVASFKAKDFNVVSALKPCNKNKNRTLNLIPLEAHRVHITPKPGADGSDYINATFVMGFNHLREFILTQHPVHDTFSDFWQMVYDHNSQTIVLLTQMNDLKDYPQFWPQKEDEVDYGSFKVKLIQESTLMKSDTSGVIMTRDFIMRSNQDDYELQTRIIHCPGWPECCGPLSRVFDLIQVVQNATQQQASRQRMHDGNTATTVTIGQEHEPQNGGPIIVVDKFGGTEAASFAVLTTLYKQINFEDAVDVYMYAKLAHLRRPGIWSSQDDYLFLYRAIENYASTMSTSNNTDNHQSQQSAPPPTNFHHQTMTLDRHRHKTSGAHALKSSTLRRSHHQHAAPAAYQQVISELSKSNNQIMLDHNHNQQASAGTKGLVALQTNSSPYNSAMSIGTSPHQHLIPYSNNPNGRQASAMVTSQIHHQAQQPPGNDNHYLYTMN